MKPVLLILLSVLCAAMADGGTIRGKVTSKETGEPLAGVSVALQGTVRGMATDLKGGFVFEGVVPGVYGLTFSIVGYEHRIMSDILIKGTETIEVDVEMSVAPLRGEPIVVTASKREQSLQDVPVSVSTVGAASIERRNTVTLDDALRHVPGVNLTDWQVNIRGSSGYSRGAGSRVLLLVDGIPFTTGDTGELNFETIPAGQIERIEVVKGAASALYGSSALGGVINVITKRIPDHPGTDVRTYGGFYGSPSFAKWRWGGGTRFFDGQSFRHSQSINNVGVMLYGSRAADDSYKQNDYRRRYNGYLRTDIHISEYDGLTATFNIMQQHRGSFLFWRNIDSALVPPPEQEGNFVESNRFFLSSQYTHTFSNRLVSIARAMWFHNRFDDMVSLSTHTSRSDVLRGEVQTTWSPDGTNTVTFGVEANTDHVDANLFGKRSGLGVAVYGQEEWEIVPELKATIGARFDYQDLDSLSSTSQFNPKVGLVYKPADGTALRASFGRGFRAPAVAEAFITTSISGLPIIPNPGLKPERSLTYEVGLNQVFGGSAVLDVALFQSDYDNLIESGLIISADSTAIQAQFNNVTRARIQGFELSANCAFFDQSLLVGAGYTYVSPKDLTTDDVLKYRPRNLLYLSGLLQTGAVSFGVDFRYISRVERIDDEFVESFAGRPPIIPDGDQRVATYVTDLRVGMDFRNLDVPLEAWLNLNNIFQYNYVELIGNLAPPRTIVLSLDVTL